MTFPLAAVLGQPIGHSRSPRIHRHWLARYGIAGDYTAIEVDPRRLAAALDHLRALGFRGANLTIPHKIEVLFMADHLSEAAEAIGAANTITFTGQGIEADNTDAYGFLTNLQQGAPDWRPGPTLCLGAGGAARAVIYALETSGVPQIFLANRTLARAQALEAPGVTVIDWRDIPEALAKATLVVNTTSLGMSGQPPLEIDLSPLPRSATVTDIVYSPLETPLLAQARAKGCATVDGLGMLLHQAAPGFERWFGRTPKVDAALRDAVLA